MALIVFILGLTIGSFLNVLILRLPDNKSILGFSECPKCKKRIVWYDNIPLLSFFILKRQCRHCRSKISWQYPLVEFLTGLLFFVSFLIYGNNPFFLIYTLFFISLFIVIAVIDLKRLVILDSLILAGFLISLVFGIWNFIGNWKLEIGNCSIISCSLKSSFIGLLFFSGIYFILFLISNGRWIGFGDVKMALWLGFTFGFKNSVDIFYLTFLFGFIIAIILLGFKKADLKTQVPLGLVMAGAGIFWLLAGFSILDLAGGELILRLWPNY